MIKKIYILGGISFSILSVMLALDLSLLVWYQNFYQSIQNKNPQEFFYNIIRFLFLSGSTALAMAVLNYVLEILDLEIKLNLSTLAIKKSIESKSYVVPNQSPIDDATLAAEKISSILPMFGFNLIKLVVLVFLLMLWAPNKLVLTVYQTTLVIPFPLLVTSAVFILIQTILASQYFPLLQRTDKLKRKVENKFRLTLLGLKVNRDINLGLKSYLSSINSLRKHTATKSFILSASIGLINTFSYALPFIALFQFYTVDVLNFGEVMKLSATFGFFQNSCSYIVANSKELSRGIAAIKRITN